MSGSRDADSAGSQRLDKWLWFSRVVKSRTSATNLVLEGKLRVNRQRVDKPSSQLRPGDVVTVAVRGTVRVLEVLAVGTRRGPPAEARLLYKELTAPSSAPGERDRGIGRPTKRDRRAIDRLDRRED
jgi:ribosome-associated heat shock protein Hsp15